MLASVQAQQWAQLIRADSAISHHCSQRPDRPTRGRVRARDKRRGFRCKSVGFLRRVETTSRGEPTLGPTHSRWSRAISEHSPTSESETMETRPRYESLSIVQISETGIDRDTSHSPSSKYRRLQKRPRYSSPRLFRMNFRSPESDPIRPRYSSH